MPIVSKSELERRRALAHNMSSNPVAARSSSEVRSRRTPAAAEVPVRAGTDAPDPLWPEGSLSAHRDYDEGKYRPPVKDRFQKGASGNPTGRPKKALGLKTVIRNAMSKKVTLRDVTGTRR